MSPFSMVGWDYTDSRRDYETLASLDDSSLHDLMAKNRIKNYVVLSTCNRFEIYFEGDNRSMIVPVEPQRSLQDHDAVNHLFRVSSGLESVSIGENEILGQVKKAFTDAQKSGRVSALLSLVFMASISCGKRVRSETGISSGKTSIPSYCADIIRSQYNGGKKSIAFIGTGDMTQRILKYMTGVERSSITVYARSQDSARNISSKLDGINVHVSDDYSGIIGKHDIIVTATDSRKPLIFPEDVGKYSRFFLDISVPANVSHDIDSMANAQVVRLQDIEPEIRGNMMWKIDMMKSAESIVEESVSITERKIMEMESQDIVAALYRFAESAGREEIMELKKEMGTGKPLDDLLEPMMNSLIKKILHPHASFIKGISKEGDFQTLNKIREHMEEIIDRASSTSKPGDRKGSRNRRHQTPQLYHRP